MIARSSKQAQSGTTIVETMVAAMLIAGFFGAAFEVNAVCLRYINASKESVAALQGVQDRLEALRNLDFASLTNPTYLQSLIVAPANGSDFAATKPTEIVMVTKYDASIGPTGNPIQITRLPGASVTPSIDKQGSGDISKAATVQLDVQYTWTAAFGGRSLTEHTATIIAAGNKK